MRCGLCGVLSAVFISFIAVGAVPARCDELSDMRSELEGLKAKLAEMEKLKERVAELENKLYNQQCVLTESQETVSEIKESLISYKYAEGVAKWPRQYRYTDAGGDLVPHPATWFNRGSYGDDPDTWVMGNTGVTVASVAETIPPEPKDWTDRFVKEFGFQGWEKIDRRTVRAAGIGERRWPDLGLSLWEMFQ